MFWIVFPLPTNYRDIKGHFNQKLYFWPEFSFQKSWVILLSHIMSRITRLRIYKRKNLTVRSSYRLIYYYRCQHNTTKAKMRDIQAILQTAPHKRLKNTNCEFSLCAKIRRLRTKIILALLIWNGHIITQKTRYRFGDSKIFLDKLLTQ